MSTAKQNTPLISKGADKRGVKLVPLVRLELTLDGF